MEWTWQRFGAFCFLLMFLLFNISTLYRVNSLGRALDIIGLGQELEAKGDLKAAVAKYEQAALLRRDSAYVLVTLGDAYAKSGDDRKALEKYQSALVQSPRHYWVHYSIGRLYEKQGRYDKAVRKFTELIEMPDNWRHTNKLFHYTQFQDLAYGDLGFCYARLGDRRRSIENYRKYLDLNPTAPDKEKIKRLIAETPSKNGH